MGAHLTACTVDDDFTFGCVANNDHGNEDVGDVYPSMDSVYPAPSSATFLRMREPQSEMQSPLKIISLPLKLKEYDSIVLERAMSPQARSVVISPLSMTSPNHDFCFDDGGSSDTQSVMSLVSPTKDRRVVAPLHLRIPILRPAGLHQPATLPDSDSQKLSFEQGRVEKFFDAPIFEAKEALFAAINRGDLDSVQHTVEHLLPPVLVSRITWPEHHNDNALHLAVRSGHLPLAQYLLMTMDNALNARNDDGESALSLAGNLRQYEILAFFMRWVVDNSRKLHSQQPEDDDASLISPYTPYPSSSLRLGCEEKEGNEYNDDVMSVLSALSRKRSVATIDDDHHLPTDDLPSDPNRVSNHLSRIFNEEEVMAWLSQLEEGHIGGEGVAATSETEGDDRQSLASTPSTSRLTMTDTATYNNSATIGKAVGRKLPLPRGVRKAAGRAFRQIGRLTAMLPRAHTHEI